MRNPRIVGDERRLLHDFMIWRQELESVEELGAYRTLERLLSVGGANPEPVTVAEISASAFQLVRVPPILGVPCSKPTKRRVRQAWSCSVITSGNAGSAEART
jgi:hypothetical protein